jgi:hypothetical protein
MLQKWKQQEIIIIINSIIITFIGFYVTVFWYSFPLFLSLFFSVLCEVETVAFQLFVSETGFVAVSFTLFSFCNVITCM